LVTTGFAFPDTADSVCIYCGGFAARAEGSAAIVGEPDGLEPTMGLIVAHLHDGFEAQGPGLGAQKEMLRHGTTPTNSVEVVYILRSCITSTKIVDILSQGRHIAPMLSPEQCRAARGWLDWSQEDLAQRANVALSTVRDFEKGRRVPIGNNLQAIRLALLAADIELLDDGGVARGIHGKPRISERDILGPALDFLNDSPGGFMMTSDLIKALEDQFAPEGDDAEILKHRSDTRFSQIVRNIVSHRKSATNLIGAGYAIYDKTRRGLQITDKGRLFLTGADP
jgi:DNA-binding transcriptional regulator YiaG